MTESNRDEADKCKRIAETALAAGDAEKAVRFLEKARRMCPDDGSIETLLAEARSGPSGSAGASGGSAHAASEGVRQRATQGASAASGAPRAAGPTRVGKDGGSYTSEQMQLVQRLLRTKDYYEALGIPRDSDEEAVKKAYKKLALKLHPDKNKAPGAEEAFKKLSKVVQCLTDAEKKQAYDRYGDEERIPQQHRQHYHQEMNAEDFFAAFFGGGAVFHQHMHRGHESDGNSGQAQRAHLGQMLPVILLVMLTLASNLFASRDGGSRFSFTQNNQYKHSRNTAILNVNYFVTDEFDDHYPEGTRDLSEFERQVDIYYVRTLHTECDNQEKMKFQKVMMAKRRGDEEELKRAKNYPKPKCKEIEKIKSKHLSIWRAAMYMGS